jgi:hypothetical protein
VQESGLLLEAAIELSAGKIDAGVRWIVGIAGCRQWDSSVGNQQEVFADAHLATAERTGLHRHRAGETRDAGRLGNLVAVIITATLSCAKIGVFGAFWRNLARILGVVETLSGRTLQRWRRENRLALVACISTDEALTTDRILRASCRHECHRKKKS